MKIITITLLALLLVGGALAQQRYVQYTGVQDYFDEKYGGVLAQEDARIPPPPITYRDPTTGQLMTYRANYAPAQPTQHAYYRIGQVPVEIVPGSYDDGYNSGYFIGYEDGIALSGFGYEAYFDYVEAHKAKAETKQGYYQFSERQVKITVTPSKNDYNTGITTGTLQGFKDGFYDIKYQGLNRDYYAYKAMLEKYPGVYEPAPIPLRPSTSFRTFPSTGYYYSGMKFYGFNYQ
jgi:hypothetical protein